MCENYGWYPDQNGDALMRLNFQLTQMKYL